MSCELHVLFHVTIFAYYCFSKVLPQHVQYIYNVNIIIIDFHNSRLSMIK